MRASDGMVRDLDPCSLRPLARARLEHVAAECEPRETMGAVVGAGDVEQQDPLSVRRELRDYEPGAEGAEGARPVADAIELRLIEDTDDPITLGRDWAEAVYYALNVPNGSSDQRRALYHAVKRRHDERLRRKS